MPPPCRSASGQASLEYVAVLALVAVVLAGAGTAVAVPDLAPRVARSMRVAICVVGGDVCRGSDAAAAGLSPCPVSRSSRSRRGSVAVVIELGGGSQWTVERRSDGSVSVTRVRGGRAGSSVGVGPGFSVPGGAVNATAGVDYALTWQSGLQWEFADRQAAGEFLRTFKTADIDALPAPTYRFLDGGGRVEAEARAGAESVIGAGAEATTESAFGRRIGRGETTYYARSELGGPDLFDELLLQRSSGGERHLVAEYTVAANGIPRRLELLTARPGPRRGQTTEVNAALDLADPENRRVAAALLGTRPPWPPAVRSRLRAVIDRARAAGTVEAHVFGVTRSRQRFAVEALLGSKLGVEYESERVERRLLQATSWTQGEPRERADCVELAAPSG